MGKKISRYRGVILGMNINDMNNKYNILLKRWESRYEKLSNEIKQRLAEFDDEDISEYQLQVIKRKRLYPQIGDVFIVKPRENLTLHGIVINNHINNINGDDLVLIMIFKSGVNVDEVIAGGIKYDDLLISPVMVGKEYWTRGYFHNIANNGNTSNIKNYGFYNIGKGKFMDEYGNELAEEPQLLGAYGVATIFGIAYEVNQELIIEGLL